LLARGSATSTGHAYQLRILDYGAEFRLYERPLITVYRPATGAAYLNISWVGFIGVVSGMNQHGVSISEIGYGDPPGEHLHGVPMPFLLKTVLRHAATADEAAAIVRAAPRTNSYIYFFGDRQGGSVGMVTSAQDVLVHRPNEQPFIEERGKRYPQFTDVLYAGHYQAKQAELVGGLAGKFDLAAVQDLARQISMKSNLHTVIYDLTDQTIWVANRTTKQRASDRVYVEFPTARAWTR
jgi:hypothetical protein